MQKAINIDIDQNLVLATDAALTAGSALVKNRSKWSVLIGQTNRDRKLLADVESEKLLIQFITDNSSYPLLTEEMGWYGLNTENLKDKNPEIFWIIDPLDGTVNYSTNIPLCSVSIALIYKGRPILGVVYDFNREELFSGGYGKGATFNGKKFNVSKTSEKSRAILMTGFPKSRNFSKEAVSNFVVTAAAWQKIRMFGSASLSLAYVANGRADAYQEDDIMFWDIAAGSALVEAAGGNVEFVVDDFTMPLSVLATNGYLK